MDLSVIFIVGLGVYLGIQKGLNNLANSRGDVVPQSSCHNDTFVYVYMDMK